MIPAGFEKAAQPGPAVTRSDPRTGPVRFEEMLWYVDRVRADRERMRRMLRELGDLGGPVRDRDQEVLEQVCAFLGHCITARPGVIAAIRPCLPTRRRAPEPSIPAPEGEAE